MVIYVALIAILNLGLGYALAMYVNAGRGQLVITVGQPPQTPDHIDAAVGE